MKTLKDTKINPSNCPYCGHRMDAAMSAVGDYSPSPDDIAICIECAEVNVYESDMTLRKITNTELVSVQCSSAWPTVERARRAVMTAKKHEVRP